MPNHFRDVISEPITLDYFHRRLADGWVVTAVEWAKSGLVSSPALNSGETLLEAPYGECVSDDCNHLAENPVEMEILAFIYDGVISGLQPGHIAATLNERSYRTRRGVPWNAGLIFELMPRIIELSPRLQKRPEWPAHRQKLNLAG